MSSSGIIIERETAIVGGIAVRRIYVLMLSAFWLAGAGCNSSPPSANSKSAPPKPTPAAMAEQWDVGEAVRHLNDEQFGSAAAWRLMNLADSEAGCRGGSQDDRWHYRLDVVPIDEHVWAAGLSDRPGSRLIACPVLIHRDGRVTRLLSGIEEELAVMYVSEDTDVFPHLLVLPHRVLIITGGQTGAAAWAPQAAFEMRKWSGVQLVKADHNGFPYVSLRYRIDGALQEACRYVWDPYDLRFTGPAADRLPEPPGGRFEVDLRFSPRLNPVGGEIPDAEPLPDRPPVQHASDEIT
jgi:hypothetical protein